VVAKLAQPFSASAQYGFPNFMIVGAQKAGTTALYEYLSKHPDIQPTKVKELHYFSCESLFKNGVEFYRSLFPIGTSSKLTFDASPSYLHNTRAPGRILAHNPNIKIIVLLRDPVERAYSAWNMYKKRYLSNRNWFFEDWVSYCGDSGLSIVRRQENRLFDFLHYAADEIELQNNQRSTILEAPIIPHGHYHDQIQRYFSLFNRGQILILENVEMLKSTVSCLRKIEAFLGISACDWHDIDLAPVFEGEYSEPVDEKASCFLREYYASSNEQLFALLGKRYQWGIK